MHLKLVCKKDIKGRERYTRLIIVTQYMFSGSHTNTNTILHNSNQQGENNVKLHDVHTKAKELNIAYISKENIES